MATTDTEVPETAVRVGGKTLRVLPDNRGLLLAPEPTDEERNAAKHIRLALQFEEKINDKAIDTFADYVTRCELYTPCGVTPKIVLDAMVGEK